MCGVQALRLSGMRDRHWEQLSEQLSMPLKPDKDFVLSKALDMHLMDHLDVIQKVSHAPGVQLPACCLAEPFLQIYIHQAYAS